MRGSVEKLVDIYTATNRTLVIPVYQRSYNWTIKQCGRLFDDLEDVISKGRAKHFFGAVVGDPEDSWTWVVIDGQQRLTTVSLLMIALTHALRDGELVGTRPDLGRMITDSHLLNTGAGAGACKLRPVQDDAEAYRRLFRREDEFIESSTITANYRYLRERLRRTALTADEVWAAIERLDVMHLDLESEDDPQRIFESLNSTGLALSEADKIRNLVLMGKPSDEQELLFRDRWNPMERNVGFRTDWFIRWWLVTRTGRTPNRAAVYDAFREHVTAGSQSIEEILEDLHRYSAICRQIETADTGYPAVDAQLRRFTTIKGDVVLPLLMPVVHDVHVGETTAEDVVAVIRILESFLFRRIVCSIPTNALNKIFAGAYGELRKLRRGGESYADVLTHILLRRTGGGRFPDDAEFALAFAERNSYAMRPNYRRYLFDCLENRRSNDCRDIADALERGTVSVEHIMPQTLTESWRRELGDDHEELHSTWVHRIANLTVTGYNADYSNRDFLRKRDMPEGFAESPYRINGYVRAQDRWGAEQLRERSRRLTDIALEYWAMPSTDFRPPRAVLPTEPLGDDASFTGRVLVAYEFDDVRQTVGSWQEMLISLLRSLVREHRPALLEFADRTPLLMIAEGTGDVVDDRGGTWPRIDASLVAAPGSSTNDKTLFLRRLFAHLNLDTGDLVFTLRPEERDGECAEEDRAAGRFADLTKFIAEFDEAASQRTEFAATAPIRGEFRSSFAPFSRDDAAADLKPHTLRDFEAAEAIADATEEQVLAALTLILRMADDFDAEAFHDRILAGTASAWLRRLEELG